MMAAMRPQRKVYTMVGCCHLQCHIAVSVNFSIHSLGARTIRALSLQVYYIGPVIPGNSQIEYSLRTNRTIPNNRNLNES